MSNLSIKINLSRIPGAVFTKLTGKSGEKKDCIVIPVETARLFVGEKGVYLDLTALEYKEQKFDSSHFVKQSIPKDIYDAMCEEERNSQPIIGSVKTFSRPQMQTDDQVYEAEVIPDLPF